MLLPVTPVTRSPPGTVGAWVSGGPPPHEALLSVQLLGSALPATMKPNAAVPPTGMVPFQPAFVNVCRLPASVRTESQLLLTEVPAGRSNATVQLVIVAVPLLVITYRPSYPVPQDETLVNAAVGPAASAGSATRTAMPTTTVATLMARKVCTDGRLMAGSFRGDPTTSTYIDSLERPRYIKQP